MNDNGTDPVATHLASISGEELLSLINQVHDLHAISIADQYGITNDADLDRLRVAPHREAMVQIAEQLKADAEYAAFFPPNTATFDDNAREAEYQQFFPHSKGN